MFRDRTRSPHDHLLLLQALMTGAHKRGSGINEEANNERAKFRRAAVAVSENLHDLRKVAACFECCTKTLRRWISKRAAGEPMGNAAVPGRPRRLDADQQAALRGYGSTRESGSAARAAAALWQEHDIEISKSTAWRILTSDGFAFRVFRRGPAAAADPQDRARAVFSALQHQRIQLLEPGHVHGLQVLHNQLQLRAQRVLPADRGATRNCAHPEARCRLAARLHGLHRLRLD